MCNSWNVSRTLSNCLYHLKTSPITAIHVPTGNIPRTQSTNIFATWNMPRAQSTHTSSLAETCHEYIQCTSSSPETCHEDNHKSCPPSESELLARKGIRCCALRRLEKDTFETVCICTESICCEDCALPTTTTTKNQYANYTLVASRCLTVAVVISHLFCHWLLIGLCSLQYTWKVVCADYCSRRRGRRGAAGEGSSSQCMR